MEIYYVGNNGEKIDFLSDDISAPYPEQELLQVNWSYNTDSRIGNKRNVSEIYKDIQERDLTLEILADDEDEFNRIMNKMHDVFEHDIRILKEGTLYFNGWYQKCFIVAKNYSNYDYLMDYSEIKVKVLIPHPFWIKEIFHSFDIQEKIYDTGMDYRYDYAFDYAPSGISYVIWDTQHYASSDFKLYVYGPCTNPLISVNGYPYQVFTTLEPNEYFVLDSKENTITKYLANGTTSSLYNSRQFVPSVFEKIPGGTINVSWNGNFHFNITLFAERSEPKWREKQPVYSTTEDGYSLITEEGENIILERKEW